MHWLIENGGTLLVSAVLLLAVGLIVRHMVRRTGDCGCGCEHCANHEFCHGKKES